MHKNKTYRIRKVMGVRLYLLFHRDQNIYR